MYILCVDVIIMDEDEEKSLTVWRKPFRHGGSWAVTIPSAVVESLGSVSSSTTEVGFYMSSDGRLCIKKKVVR